MSTNTPLLPQALTSVEALEERLGVTGKAGKMINVINRVSRFIENTIERKIMARNYDGTTKHPTTAIPAESPLYFDWDDFVKTNRGYELYLPAFPIHRGGDDDITFELAYLSQRDSTGETFSTANITEWEDYIIEEDDGVIIFPNFPTVTAPVSPNIRIYRLKATLGFEDIPEAVEMAALELCEMMYRDGKGVTSERLGSWAKTYDLSKQKDMIEDSLGEYCRYKL
jgi:hypothetical protein